MTKKILVYCPTFLPNQSGYSHAFAGLIENLLNDGFYVDVLVPEKINGSEPLKHPRLNMIRKSFSLRIWLLGLFYEYFCLAQYLYQLNRQNNYDVIFIETGDHPLILAFMRESLLYKTVVRFHSTSDTEYLLLGKHFKYKLKRFLWKWLAATRVKNICATSEYHVNYAADLIIGHHAFNYRDVVVNTVDVAENSLLNAPPDRTFFMLGRMDEEGYKQKGFDVLLKALPMVSKDFETTNSKLIMTGNGTRYETFKQEIAGYSFIDLHQAIPHEQVKELLQNHIDIVLLPSIYEGVSMFALEALGYGKAVIFGATGGLVDMVQDNGILVEPGNPDALAGAIRELIYSKQLAGLKQHSQEIASKLFSAQKQMEQFQRMIKTISC